MDVDYGVEIVKYNISILYYYFLYIVLLGSTITYILGWHCYYWLHPLETAYEQTKKWQ